MKFLLDTNAIIPAEPTSRGDIEAETPNVTKLIGLIAKCDFQVYVHPESLSEIKGDQDTARRDMRQQLFSKYLELPAPPSVTSEMASVVGMPKPGSHDAVDLLMLAALFGNAVNFLVTNDNGIHRRALRLGFAERVLTIEDALVTVQGLLPEPVETPPAVELVPCHQLRKDDVIFDSLREDYDHFDSWLEKIQLEHRQVFVIKDGERHAAIAIIKLEDVTDIGIEGPVLKICTFKVADTGRGFRYGELLLRAIFDYVHNEKIPRTYMTCYPKQEGLMRFLDQFGFAEHSRLENEEVVFIKQFVPQSSDRIALSPLDFHKQFGPYQMKIDGIDKFVVPIQPQYHQLLFPNLENQRTLFEGERACGNSILKAYLCHSVTKTLSPGSLIFFYRSQDSKSVRAVGVVDAFIRSSSANEVAQFVGKRTVYSFDDIKEMCQKETLAILFRYAKEIPEVNLADLTSNNALSSHPQQITRIKSGGEKWIKELIEQ